MATSRAGAQLTSQHQAAQLAVRAGSVQQLMRLWRGVDPTRLADTIDTFVTAAVLLAQQGHERSAQEAIRYFESFRRAEGIRGTLTIPAAPLPPAGEIAADLRGAALAGIVTGRRRGMSLTKASDNGLVRVAGALIKRILTGGRMTIITGAANDRAALGWARVTTGDDPCAFCRMLSSRGPVYKTEKAAEFDTHATCACVPEVVYAGDPLDVGPVRQTETYLAEYTRAQEWARESGTMSVGTSNNALNNYRRWLANGSPEPGQ